MGPIKSVRRAKTEKKKIEVPAKKQPLVKLKFNPEAEKKKVETPINKKLAKLIIDSQAEKKDDEVTAKKQLVKLNFKPESEKKKVEVPVKKQLVKLNFNPEANKEEEFKIGWFRTYKALELILTDADGEKTTYVRHRFAKMSGPTKPTATEVVKGSKVVKNSSVKFKRQHTTASWRAITV